MARTITAGYKTKMQAASQSGSDKPIVHLYFFTNYEGGDQGGSTNYSSRVLGIEHREAPYSEEAIIILNNYDGNIIDLTGKYFEIGYGYAGEGQPPWDFPYVWTSRMYVTAQTAASAEGVHVTILECEGIWSILNQTLIHMGSAPFNFFCWNGTYTIDQGGTQIPTACPGGNYMTNYDIVYAILAHCTGEAHPYNIHWLLETNTSHYDWGWTVDTPASFSVNEQPFEYASDVIRSLMARTKMMLRSKPTDQYHWAPFLEAVVPSDCGVVETFNSGSSPYFIEYRNRERLIFPNYTFVFGGKNEDGTWRSDVWGIGSESGQWDKFMTIVDLHLVGATQSSATCAAYAQALQSKSTLEASTGSALINHDVRIELFDKVTMNNTRSGGSGQGTGSTTHTVAGLTHRWNPGTFTLEMAFGGVMPGYTKIELTIPDTVKDIVGATDDRTMTDVVADAEAQRPTDIDFGAMADAYKRSREGDYGFDSAPPWRATGGYATSEPSGIGPRASDTRGYGYEDFGEKLRAMAAQRPLAKDIQKEVTAMGTATPGSLAFLTGSAFRWASRFAGYIRKGRIG